MKRPIVQYLISLDEEEYQSLKDVLDLPLADDDEEMVMLRENNPALASAFDKIIAAENGEE